MTTTFVRTLDCAHKVRLRLFLDAVLDEPLAGALAAALEAEGVPASIHVERFSTIVGGAKDLIELRAPELYASGPAGGRELTVTFGRFGAPGDPAALHAFAAACARTPLGPPVDLAEQRRDCA